MKHIFACALAGVLCLAAASAHAQDTAEQEKSAPEEEGKRTQYSLGITGGTLASFNNAQNHQDETTTDPGLGAAIGLVWGAKHPWSPNFSTEIGNQIAYTSTYHSFLNYSGRGLEERFYFFKMSTDLRLHRKLPALIPIEPSIFLLFGYQFRAANFYKNRNFTKRVTDHGYQVGFGLDALSPIFSRLKVRQEYIFSQNFDGTGNKKRGLITHDYAVGLLYPF